MSPELSPPPEVNERRFRIPTLEDWIVVQGGKPTLWLNNSRNNLRVVHIYENSPNEFTGSGMVIDTIATVDETKPQLSIRLNPPDRKMVLEKGHSKRLVYFPTFMLYRFHGEPCEARSREARVTTLPSEKKYSTHDFSPSNFADYKNLMERDHTQLKLVPKKDLAGIYHYSWVALPSKSD